MKNFIFVTHEENSIYRLRITTEILRKCKFCIAYDITENKCILCLYLYKSSVVLALDLKLFVFDVANDTLALNL